MPDLPKGRVTHLTPHRLRIKIKAKRYDESFFSAVEDYFTQRPTVDRVEVNSATAGVLVHSANSRALLAAIRDNGLFTVVEDLPPPAQPILVQIRDELSDFNDALQDLTGTQQDMRGYLFLALVVSAGYQILRGEIFSPATTLLWYAGEALRLWVPKDQGGTNGSTEA